ncbi:MAG: transglutaminase domain-containing protein [Planctomycetes bacterium]|nr:transglutaminase domain-containing protein [Planctomycetota bacterium]
MRVLSSIAAAAMACVLALSTASGAPPAEMPEDVDSDGDGLADYDEVHKYLTDPENSDSDGDGTMDGGWDERREFTYSIRFLFAHVPPAEAVNDAFQDARVAFRSAEAVELEIVAYPLATGHREIPDDPSWREKAASLAEWTKPNFTCDFDDAMTAELVAALKKDGIDPAALGDRSLVEHVSQWAFQRATSQPTGFTTAYTTVKDGRLAIVPGLEQVFRDNQRDKSLTVEQQFDLESRGRAMFRSGRCGTCTSSAIYLQTLLRALGVPARTTVAIPACDASSPGQIELLREALIPSAVGDEIIAGSERNGAAWASHTFNIVFAGGRWRPLNYSRLGQPIVDHTYGGILLRILDYDDRAASGTAETWGRRQGLDRKSARFPGSNPYYLLAVSDAMGAHAKVTLAPPVARREHKTLTIVRASWVTDFPDAADWVELAIEEWFDDQNGDQYKRFTQDCDRQFYLRADGLPDVLANCGVGSITGPGRHSVMLHMASTTLSAGVAYRIVPRNSHETLKWVVRDDVTIAR